MGAAKEPRLVLETLNTKLDHPGYAVSSLATAARVVEAVGDPRFGILADLYHLGMMGEDLVPLVRRYGGMIGYIHVADVPGRHEPGTGKVDWVAVLEALRDSGYDGYAGFEFSPAGSSDAALEAIRALWDRFSAGAR
jgi:hydroxypyruvate isomerase